MKKKILRIAGIGLAGLVFIAVIIMYMEIQKRKENTGWQIAKEIYRVENALKEVDEDYECLSVSKVTPFPYTDSEGNTVIYYCCQTAYLENQSGKYTGLDMNAIGLVIDLELIENKRECTVNEYDAFLCEMGERSYLCWTLSPSSRRTATVHRTGSSFVKDGFPFENVGAVIDRQ